MSDIELMKKYGVAWFGFDEPSGVVIDKLGNGYIGTLTNTPPRVAGWNGKGYALSFNGSNQYVQFSNKFIPINEKTIRFKIKLPLTTAPNTLIFDTCGYAGGNYGIWIASVGGRLGFSMLQGSGKENAIYSTMLNDEKWHDIMIVVESQADSLSIMRMYVDEKIVSSRKMNFSLVQDSTYNLRLGFDNDGNTGGTLGYFKGQLDDLQIYNKALAPSDFGLKRLIFQSEEKQVLSISKNSNRIKSFSSVNEDILLKYCYEINEIDNAVDAEQYIDLYKTTKEYEVINTGSTSLGKGKLFTVPLNAQYKTAVIEN